MKPRSATLFHFTKGFDTLKGILLNGLMPRYCLEDTRWLSVPGHDFIAYPMVCFCDIPISRISEHTAFYGSYGIGLTKRWGLQNKLAPIIYAPPGSAAASLADYLLRVNYNSLADAKERNFARRTQVYRLLSNMKPLAGQMIVGGTPIEKDFYQESEWRFVPQGASLLWKNEFDEMRASENQAIESEKLSLAPEDVRYLLVQHEHEIPELIDFINTKLGDYSLNALKILGTRIFSLEQLGHDL